MIQELNYRFFYLLQDLLQKAQNTQISLTTFDWRRKYMVYASWEWEKQWSIRFNGGRLSYDRKCRWAGNCVTDPVLYKETFQRAAFGKEVAARFFISPVYVGRVIQQASGETFKQYVNRLKMEEAKQLLSSSDQLVYEIAEELGFKDSKYFISRFYRRNGDESGWVS